MRGTRVIGESAHVSDRIIPAHAGNSCSSVKLTFAMSDHPRACGELRCRIDRRDDHRGSSPRMRGTHGEWIIGHSVSRIIPAHAGNSFSLGIEFHPIPDHPRACGELLRPEARAS